MDNTSSKSLSPVSFLQAFIVQSVKVAESNISKKPSEPDRYIEQVGLTASQCLEEGVRETLDYSGPITPDQYADIIINIKNRIGGNFSRASSPPGTIRVVSSCCPFGNSVHEAPELCRMTASVFGGIAARNFGYGKIELRKRIALNDDYCEVCIYTNPEDAQDKPGDEYHSEGDKIVSRTKAAEVRARIEGKLREVWCVQPETPYNAVHRQLGLVAESRAMHEALEAVEIVAPTLATVLISGETGVGKEVIARAIHAMSERSEQEFIAVNCGAIPENLIESALFGHERGAFTSAYNVHQGLFERANRGTLFLDEIDSLPITSQVRLLRVLQEGEFERVGGHQTQSTNARIIAASNQDLEDAVRRERFRHDLFYRLNVVPIYIAPLRDRIDDIPPLVYHFLARLSQKYSTPAKVLDNKIWQKLLNYSWPGNLRELENVLERAFLFARGTLINELELSQNKQDNNINLSNMNLHDTRQLASREAESALIIQTLKEYKGNVSAVARVMGITPRAVHMRLKSLDIKASTYR